jgi:molybdopterin-guanine dinucleotide biosynthesis protein A
MKRSCLDSSDNDTREKLSDNGRIAGVTGVILAGGASSRMGSNKALMEIGGQTLIERVYTVMTAFFRDVIIVTNSPDLYAFIPCRTAADIYPGAGSLAGLHAGLSAGSTERIFVAACDMPFLNHALIRLLCQSDEDCDAVVPVNAFGLREPLHALYARSALGAVQQAIERGDMSILHLLDRLQTRYVTHDLFRSIVGAEESFRNVNTPEEFAEVMELELGDQRACGCAK